MADPVSLQVQTPNSMQTLGNIMNIANTAQSLKKSQATFAADVAQRKAESKVAVETAGPRIEQQQQDTAQSQIATHLKQFQLDTAHAQKAMEIAGALVQDPAIVNGDAGGSVKALLEAKDRMIAFGIPKEKAEVQVAPLMAMAAHNPKALQQVLKNIIVGGQASASQAATVQPGGPTIGSGQVTQQINTNPFSTAPAGPIAGTQVQQEIPPTATTVSPTGQPTYVGPRRGGQAVPAANPPGLEASARGAAETSNKDWESTVEAAKTASTDIANLQNIKRFSASAQTGVGSERRAFVAGLAGLLGMDAGEMSKTSTDLLAKNANMLALAGGDTNLAKTLAESANPNTHMTKEAINEAANQVLSQRRQALAKQEFMQRYKALNDPNAYSSALTAWNQVADPRIFQWDHMSKEEKQHMKTSMSAKEQGEFRKKIERAVELGIVK